MIPSWWPLALIAFIGVAVGGAVYMAFLYRQRSDAKWRRQVSETLQLIGAETLTFDSSLRGLTANYIWRHGHFCLTYVYGGKYTLPYYFLGLSVASDDHLYIERRGATDRILTLIHVGGNMRTDDPDFDKEFAMDSETPGFASTILSNAGHRKTLRSLFSTDVTSFELRNHQMVALWRNNNRTMPDIDTLKIFADAMLSLTDHCGDGLGTSPIQSKPPSFFENDDTLHNMIILFVIIVSVIGLVYLANFRQLRVK